VCDLETSRMGAPYIYIYIYMTLVAYGLKVKSLEPVHHCTFSAWATKP